MKVLAFRCCLLLALAVANAPALASDFSQHLEQLNDLRLKDRNQFQGNVRQLYENTDKTTLSNTELGHLLLLTAWDHVLTGDFERALNQLEQVDTNISAELELKVSSLKTNIYVLSYRYSDAFLQAEQVLVSLPTIREPSLYTQVAGPLILLYNNVERFELVNQLIDQGLRITSDNALRCRLIAPKLQGAYKTKNFQQYSLDFDSTHSLCELANEVIFSLLIIRNHMFYLLEQQQAAAALAFYRQYYSQVEQINYPILTAGFNAAAAEALLQQGELAAASELAQRAEQSLPGDRNDPAVLSTYRVLTLLAQAERNFDNLLRYSEKRRDTELAIAREKASQQLAYQLASGEARLKEQRIQLLDKDNELLTLERNLYQQQAENRYLLLLLIGSLSLILGLLTYRGLTRSKRYRKMAEFDQLTGISNRYHFTEQAQREIAHCIRAKRPVALILFDLDHFKNINDRFGHAAGDWTLQQVVLSCRNFIRHSDIFGRIGGEEFVILLTDCTAEQAVMLADICRTALADIDTSGYQPKFKVTASFGISDSEQAGYDLSALLAAADAAMYQAKQQGRNQVYCPATADGARAC
jgi:diguanylate cyclase (GGDEF)-like protein